jgi:hypothetical protein
LRLTVSNEEEEDPMLNHVVLLKFKTGVAESDITKLEERLDDLPNKIPEILVYEFGRNTIPSERAYDFALVSLFANPESLERYRQHPDHLKVLDLIKDVSENIITTDFWDLTQVPSRKKRRTWGCLTFKNPGPEDRAWVSPHRGVVCYQEVNGVLEWWPPVVRHGSATASRHGHRRCAATHGGAGHGGGNAQFPGGEHVAGRLGAEFHGADDNAGGIGNNRLLPQKFIVAHNSGHHGVCFTKGGVKIEPEHDVLIGGHYGRKDDVDVIVFNGQLIAGSS